MLDTITLFIVFGASTLIAFLISTICEKWTNRKVMATYKKYPMMKQYKHNIDALNERISYYCSMYQDNKNKIDKMRTKFPYLGETEDEAKELKALQKQSRAWHKIIADLTETRATYYKERNDFISSHNIRYY